MITTEQVIEALRPIEDPEIHRSIVELGMVRAVEIEAGVVSVELALTTPGCPLKDHFQRAIPAAVRRIEGVRDVVLRFGSMSEEERRALSAKLGHHAPAVAPIPFGRAGSRTRVIAVASGKGGVGKSTVSVNLAASLAQLGYTTALLDADVWGFSVPRMLGVSGRPEAREGKMVPAERHGVRAISMGFFVEEEQPVIWRGPMLHQALTQFLSDVDWGEPDFLIVDMPPGTGDITISLAQMLPGASLVVVTTPQRAAQKVAERAARTTVQTKQRILGIVENMAGFDCQGCGAHEDLFGEGGGQLLAEALGVPLLGQIPLDRRLMEGGDEGEPFVTRYPETDIARTYAALAERVAAWVGAYAERRVFVEIGRRPAAV